MPMSHAFRTENLSVTCDGRQIFSDVSFAAPRHTVTSVVGPSGVGKTTLLRSINRLLEEEPGYEISGQVFVNEAPIYDSRVSKYELRRRVGIVFQKPVIFPMSIARNVTFGSRHVPTSQLGSVEAHIQKCLRDAFLWDEVKDRLDSPGLSLSVGQQQRLAIARALAVEPEILLMDEPTSALDDIASRKIEELILSLRNSRTIVIVTHNRQQAERISDQILTFEARQSGASASTQQIRNALE